MKLLLENWRQYLNERKTDEIYSRLVDLFVSAYSNDKNFEYESEEEEREYGDDFDFDAMRAKFAASGFLQQQDEEGAEEHSLLLLEPRAQEIIEKIDEIDPGAEIFPWQHRDIYVLPNLIFKYDEEQDHAGSWNKDENELIVYLDGIVSRQEYDNMTEGDIRNYVRSADYRSYLKTIINHEFTHYLNSVRADTTGMQNKPFRDTKRAKQMVQKFFKVFPGASKDIDEVKRMIAYINSTEEAQARLIPIYKKIQSFIDSAEDFDNVSGIDELNLIRGEVESRSPDIKKIVKYMKNIYDSEHNYFWDFTAEPLRKRILQRFYQFALQLIKAAR